MSRRDGAARERRARPAFVDRRGGQQRGRGGRERAVEQGKVGGRWSLQGWPGAVVVLGLVVSHGARRSPPQRTLARLLLRSSNCPPRLVWLLVPECSLSVTITLESVSSAPCLSPTATSSTERTHARYAARVLPPIAFPDCPSARHRRRPLLMNSQLPCVCRHAFVLRHRVLSSHSPSVPRATPSSLASITRCVHVVFADPVPEGELWVALFLWVIHSARPLCAIRRLHALP